MQTPKIDTLNFTLQGEIKNDTLKMTRLLSTGVTVNNLPMYEYGLKLTCRRSFYN